ncbi:MAG: RES family NAD+ phosphorylase [Alphaproteobacteria bacterium]|nr:RES family NAD+ phosphorylase [Alphaproteobacteria bacterium]
MAASNYEDLSGRGGLIASGRWHNRGRAVVYCAESLDLARIEVEQGLGLPAFLWPDSYRLLRVSVPGTTRIEHLQAEDLPLDWRDDILATRRIGDAWLRSNRAALLRVPPPGPTGSTTSSIRRTVRPISWKSSGSSRWRKCWPERSGRRTRRAAAPVKPGLAGLPRRVRRRGGTRG